MFHRHGSSVPKTADAEQHYSTGEECLIDGELAFPAYEEPAKIAQPRECSLHPRAETLISLAYDHWSASFGSPRGRPPPGRNAHPNAATAQCTTKVSPIIAAICDYFLRSLSGPSSWPPDRNRVQGLFGELNFGTCSAVQVESQRQTIRIYNEHPLRSLALSGESDLVAALFGGRKRAVYETYRPIELSLAI
jgi:hypothetical protein